MGYQKAIEIAGAEVHCFEEFGSYQGDWYAKVTYEGKTGWVHGSYGSCSGCDAFQAEFDSFGNAEHEHDGKTYYDPIYNGFKDGCDKCDAVKARLIAFGKNYLDNIITQEEAEKEAGRNIEWDMDAEAMLEFIKKNK